MGKGKFVYSKGNEIMGSLDLTKILHAILLQNGGQIDISNIAYKEAARRGLDKIHFYSDPIKEYTAVRLERGPRDPRYDRLTDYKNKRQIVVALMSEKMGLSVTFEATPSTDNSSETVMVGDRGARVASVILPEPAGGKDSRGSSNNSPNSL